jgi:hypothetical protein
MASGIPMIFAAKRRFGGAGGSVVDYVIYNIEF